MQVERGDPEEVRQIGRKGQVVPEEIEGPGGVGRESGRCRSDLMNQRDQEGSGATYTLLALFLLSREPLDSLSALSMNSAHLYQTHVI